MANELKAIVPTELAIKGDEPLLPSSSVAREIAAYLGVQREIDAALSDCIIMLPQKGGGTKPFRKKAYWRAIATAYRLDCSLVSETRDPFGEDVLYRAIYEAKAPNGRRATGDGAASRRERGSPVTEHIARALAHTRAYNRAVSNLVGFGEVSAEEAEAPEQPARPEPPKPSQVAMAILAVLKAKFATKELVQDALLRATGLIWTQLCAAPEAAQRVAYAEVQRHYGDLADVEVVPQKEKQHGT